MTEEEHYLNLLQDILYHKKLTPLFQPIISITDQNIFGYEALIRGPSDSPLHSPFMLFDTAAKNGLLGQLDLLCREVIIKSYGKIGLKSRLFINSVPAAILQKDYPHGMTLEFIEAAKIDPQLITIELTEQYPIDDYNLMRAATNHYRAMGFSIAIDDLGAGYSGLRTWSEIKPDYVKLDKHFLQNIHEDNQKWQFVKSMIDIAKGIGSQVIGEGVEVRQEYLSVESIGLKFAQGYYFGRPQRHPLKTLGDNLFKQRVPTTMQTTGRPRSNTLVGSLLTELEPVDINANMEMVADRFQIALKTVALPVVYSDYKVAGIIWRDEFMTLYASRYGKELYSRKPITTFMNKTPIIVETDLPLQKLSQQITSQESNHQHSVFIITEQGKYAGTGNLFDLLRQITDMQITVAKHANPLTGLPGNVPISERVKEIISKKLDMTLCYFDLDNFKPYNDIYGFAKGDVVIRLTANTLTQFADEHIDFVGHVGGDDFIVLFESQNWKARCQLILDKFASLYPQLYQQQHLDQQGIQAKDRHGNPAFYSLLSLSIGAVRPIDIEQINSEATLAEFATKAKSMAKKINGNSLYQITSTTTISEH